MGLLSLRLNIEGFHMFTKDMNEEKFKNVMILVGNKKLQTKITSKETFFKIFESQNIYRALNNG